MIILVSMVTFDSNNRIHAVLYPLTSGAMIYSLIVPSPFSHCHREDKHPAAVSSSAVGQKGWQRGSWFKLFAIWEMLYLFMVLLSFFIRTQLKSESRIRRRRRTRRLRGKLPGQTVGSWMRIHKCWCTPSRDWSIRKMHKEMQDTFSQPWPWHWSTQSTIMFQTIAGMILIPNLWFTMCIWLQISSLTEALFATMAPHMFLLQDISASGSPCGPLLPPEENR